MPVALRFRPSLWPTLLVLPAICLMLGLGMWQLQRRAWKLDLIATVHERMALPPVPVEQLEQKGMNGDALAYRPVVVAGRFDHARTRYLFTGGGGPGGVPGYHVLTPLARASGPAILIDRGFVPQSMREPSARPGSEPGGLVTVQGLIRLSARAQGFTPKGEQDGGVWFSRDIPALSAALGVPLAPFAIEADATPNQGGWPLGGQTRVEFRNAHLSYAITWFSLAIALAVIYLLYHRKAGRLEWQVR